MNRCEYAFRVIEVVNRVHQSLAKDLLGKAFGGIIKQDACWQHHAYRTVFFSSIEGQFGKVGKEIGVAHAREREAAAVWLAFGGFQGRESEPFSALTYGEQRLLLILRALVKSPPLLILDEPCHGLDESNRAKVLSLLEKIAEKKMTTLLHVTHEPDEVLPCERRILEMEKGGVYRLLTR